MTPASLAKERLLAANYTNDLVFERAFESALSIAVNKDLNFVQLPHRPSPEMLLRLSGLGYTCQYDFKSKTLYAFFA